MYLEFYKLREYPFTLGSDERFFYESPIHAEALANMAYTIQQRKGMVLITGEVGAGKTFVGSVLGSRLGPGCMMVTMQDPPERLPRQWWEAGVYENEYIKKDGIWQIRLLNYNLQWQASFEEGWANTDGISVNSPATYPEDPTGPDELHSVPPKIWPETYCVPFHYEHPVTGQSVRC